MFVTESKSPFHREIIKVDVAFIIQIIQNSYKVVRFSISMY